MKGERKRERVKKKKRHRDRKDLFAAKLLLHLPPLLYNLVR